LRGRRIWLEHRDTLQYWFPEDSQQYDDSRHNHHQRYPADRQ
jgi:hypothetical protein